MLTTNVQALFHNFKEGINHLNLIKVVDCYHLPCTLNTPDKLSLINTKAELESEVKSLFTQLTKECFYRFELSNTSYMKLTDDMIFASIDWTFIDDNHQVFSEFSAFYHLVIKDKKLKIINATSHQINNGQRLLIPFVLTSENKQ
tara:strand:+ start:359 stop:793 length:435 start_codon:yes stop_codon:yes gene_type:complete